MGARRPRSTRPATSGRPPATASSTTPYDGSDSVHRALTRAGPRSSSSRRATGRYDNSHDQDLARPRRRCSRTGRSLQVGKSQRAYLLSQASLGGIGGQLDVDPGCARAPTSTAGTPSSGSIVYVPCHGGLQAMQTSPARACCGRRPTTSGTPDHAGGLVWSIGGSDALRARSHDRRHRADSSTSAARPTTSPPRRSATGSSWHRPPIRSTPSRARPASPGRRRRRRPHRRTPPTGWTPPTAASSPSAAPASSARPAACR